MGRGQFSNEISFLHTHDVPKHHGFPYTMVSQQQKGKLCERLRFVQEKYDFRQRLLHAEESLKYLTHRLVIVWQWRGGE